MLRRLWGKSCPHLVCSRLPCVRSREFLQNFLMILGPGGFHRERIAMKQQIKITCWAKLRKVIICLIINMKSAFKWASRVDLTLPLSQHISNRRIVQILVLLLSEVCVCCRIGISSNDILDAEVLFWKTVEHAKVSSWPNRGGDGIHNTVVSKDLIWLSWLSLVSVRVSCPLTRISDFSFCLFTKFLVFFFTWFPQESNISCGINSCVDWQIIASAWVASHQSQCPQATVLRLLISCQPPLSETHARSCFPRILWVVTNRRHWTFHLWQQACSGSLVSGIHSSGWRNPFCCRECCTGTLASYKVQRVYLFFPHRLREDKSVIIKPCLCEFVFRSSMVHLVRVRMKFQLCLIFSNSRIVNSFRHWWRHITSLHCELFFIIFNRLSYLAWHPIRSSENIAHAHLKVENGDRHLRELILGTIYFLSWNFDQYLHFRAPSWVFLVAVFSSSNTKSMLCRENARAS